MDLEIGDRGVDDRLLAFGRLGLLCDRRRLLRLRRIRRPALRWRTLARGGVVRLWRSELESRQRAAAATMFTGTDRRSTGIVATACSEERPLLPGERLVSQR